MGRISSITVFAYLILVSFIILTCVELSQSCHRRVEYVQYYKKPPPPKGHGHGYQGGGHGGHGHGGHGGHGHGGHGHRGHSQGGYGYGGHKGYDAGGHKGYGGGGGHKGYEEGGGGHKGYGGGGHKGYGGGGHKGYGGGGGGHKGYGGGDSHDKGYGQGHDPYGGGQSHGGGGHKGYGHSEKGQYGMYTYGQGHGHGGYGSQGHHGNEGYSHGHDHNMGHHEPHGHTGYGHGHEQDGYGYGGGYEQPSHGKGHQDGGQKGKRYKYQSYESMHYNDKGGHQPSHDYSHSAPHYMQKGYGYSGPYPNTEYSSPVETSVNAPTGPTSFSDGIGDISDDGGVVDRLPSLPPQLDAADTADLIRSAYDSTKENELVHRPLGNLGNSGVGHLIDNGGRQSNGDYNSVDGTPTLNAQYPPSGNSPVDSLGETGVNQGNFDLNLNYNAADLPAPFRRNIYDSALGASGGRSRLSSRYRGNMGVMDHDEHADGSQSQQTANGGPGPDYLENDTGDVDTSGSLGTKASDDPTDFVKMNF